MDIKQLIKECVKEQLERRIVREIVAEQLHKMWESGELNEAFFETSDDNNSGETDTMEKSRALSLLKNTLDKNPLNKKSEIAHALHPGVDKDSARCMFNNRMWESGELNESFFEASDDNNGGKSDETSKTKALGQLNTLLDKNPLIKKSKIAYALHPGVDKDAARHIFNDQLKGEDPIESKDIVKAIDMIHHAGIGA